MASPVGHEETLRWASVDDGMHTHHRPKAESVVRVSSSPTSRRSNRALDSFDGDRHDCHRSVTPSSRSACRCGSQPVSNHGGCIHV